MTDNERISQLLVIELEQTVDKLEAITLTIHDSTTNDAAELFGWAFEGVRDTLDAFKKHVKTEDIGGPLGVLFEAAELLYQAAGDDSWTYVDNMRMIVALRLVIRILTEELKRGKA